jgi:hypothetical protein
MFGTRSSPVVSRSCAALYNFSTDDVRNAFVTFFYFEYPTFVMSQRFGSVLRNSKFWIPTACTLPLINYNSHNLRSRLDDGAEEQASALTKANARTARRDEILKAAREFTTFADNGPSGKVFAAGRV